MITRDAALARLRAQDFGSMIVRFVNDVLASPRRPRAPVAYDFWRQVKLMDELEEIRQYRPAAFRALPFESDEAVADVGPGVKARIHR